MEQQEKTLEPQTTEKQEVEMAEGTERTRAAKAFIPRADIFENDDALMILADMPGVNEEAVDITLEKNVLSIKGFVDQTLPEGFGLAYAEYEIGDFERNFTLSDGIDQDNITASLSNGVLSVNLPKAGPAKARKISVTGA